MPNLKKKKDEERKILEDIIVQHAHEILRKIGAEDPKVSSRINQLAHEYLAKERGAMGPDEVAQSLFSDLDTLDVEYLYDHSGRTRYGYVEPSELASDMFQEQLEPYLDELRKWFKLSMPEESKLYCIGIMKGLYKFEKESTTEFADWIVDEPHESFIAVFDEWRKVDRNVGNLNEVKEFVKKNFPEWFESIRKRGGR